MTSRPLLLIAGLSGAAGVALAARGTHAAEGDVSIAANFLLLHAATFIGISLLPNRLSQIAGYVLFVALLLFAGDLVLRGEYGHSLFPLAAPAGGIGLIVGWLLLAVSALVGKGK